MKTASCAAVTEFTGLHLLVTMCLAFFFKATRPFSELSVPEHGAPPSIPGSFSLEEELGSGLWERSNDS